jgi:hypothetical protein
MRKRHLFRPTSDLLEDRLLLHGGVLARPGFQVGNALGTRPRTVDPEIFFQFFFAAMLREYANNNRHTHAYANSYGHFIKIGI